MTARKYKRIRLAALLIWLVLALITVAPVIAQDGGGSSNQGGVQADNAPAGLDELATRLSPLLVGAALIERTLELLFNWVERAILDASHYLYNIACRLTGLVQVDLRQAWGNLNELKAAVLARQMNVTLTPDQGNPNSANMADWPLAVLEAQLVAAQAQVAKAEDEIKVAMDSPVYKLRKKMAAAWLSMGMGILLAFTASVRLFEPIGVHPASWFKGAFDVVDLILAGVLMGLGTDWVHQVIGLLIQGKGFLGRAGGGQYDLEQVQTLASLAVQQQVDQRLKELREEILGGSNKPTSKPPT